MLRPVLFAALVVLATARVPTSPHRRAVVTDEECKSICAVRDDKSGWCFEVKDGTITTCPKFCEEESPRWDKVDVEAFKLCVQTNPLCFERAETCITDSRASAQCTVACAARTEAKLDACFKVDNVTDAADSPSCKEYCAPRSPKWSAGELHAFKACTASHELCSVSIEACMAEEEKTYESQEKCHEACASSGGIDCFNSDSQSSCTAYCENTYPDLSAAAKDAMVDCTEEKATCFQSIEQCVAAREDNYAKCDEVCSKRVPLPRDWCLSDCEAVCHAMYGNLSPEKQAAFEDCVEKDPLCGDDTMTACIARKVTCPLSDVRAAITACPNAGQKDIVCSSNACATAAGKLSDCKCAADGRDGCGTVRALTQVTCIGGKAANQGNGAAGGAALSSTFQLIGVAVLAIVLLAA